MSRLDALALAPMLHATRRDRLREAWQQAAPDTGRLLVTEPADVRYLSGFTGTNGQVLIAPAANGDRLVTDARYELRAATEAPDLPTTVARDAVAVALRLLDHERSCTRTNHDGCDLDAPGDPEASDEGAVPAVPAARPGRALVVEPEHTSWASAQRWQRRGAELGIEVVGVSGLVAGLRVVKDDGEVARLARACALTQDALDWLLDEVVAVGRTERELARRLEDRFLDVGADGVGFPSIVASGPNSAIPHHTPTDRALRPGDLLTIDCGAIVDGYHADYTRTVAIGGLSDELTRVHELVVAAQAAGRAAAVASASAASVDAACRTIIEEAGYGERFVHGTGHGVGLEIHELPAVAQASDATLAPGMALTIEPGVYLPGIGGVRIEDTIVVTADGPARPLTDTPRGLRIL